MDILIEKTVKDEAIEHYTSVGKDFYDALDFCFWQGWVINTPYLFAMGSFYEEDGETICFIEYAIGDLWCLTRFCLPIVIDKVEFRRNFRGRIRRYDFDRFERLVCGVGEQ